MNRNSIVAAFAAVSALALAPAALAQDGEAVEALDCEARKFETIVDLPGPNGTARQSRIRLCGARSQTDSQWVKTLSDAVAKIEANDKMPVSARAQAIAAIRTEIARIQPSAALAVGTEPPRLAIPAAPVAPRRNDPIEGLPPLITGQSRPAVSTATAAGNAAVPGAAVAARSTPAAAPPPRAPRLTVQCDTPGERAATCDPIRSATMLAIRHGEAIDGGWALRIDRRGDDRGEVRLSPGRKGMVQRVRLPAALCQGVTSSTVTFQLVRAGSAGPPSASYGPWLLRC